MKLGTTKRPLTVAIIGAGPAGYFAAESLFSQTEIAVRVDMFERLPTPFGLVRGGVAPDHQNIKAVSRIFERTAMRPGHRFFGNVTFGRDIELDDLARYYDQVVYAVGSEGDRRLRIAGEDLAQCVPAAAFVGWYNGHPDFTEVDIDLTAKRVAVIGNGNVAIDVARILTRSVADLRRTDMADHALDALRDSRVEDVYVLGRRGPFQAAFSPQELREIGKQDNADPVVSSEMLAQYDGDSGALAGTAGMRNMELFQKFSTHAPTKSKRIHFRFGVAPVEIVANERGRVGSVTLEKNRLISDDAGTVRAEGTGVYEALPVDLVIPAIGFRSRPLPDVPHDHRKGVIVNAGGRVVRACGDVQLPILEYVVGWAQTGPRGLIGSHKAGSQQVVEKMLQDVNVGLVSDRVLPPSERIESLFSNRGIKWVGFDGWLALNRVEVDLGKDRDAPRRKLTDVSTMLDVARNISK